eukprot:778-Heterococcus_DN1.PRE.3
MYTACVCQVLATSPTAKHVYSSAILTRCALLRCLDSANTPFRTVHCWHYYHTTAVQGRWNASYGTCTDHVVRGCHNNGTCVAPGTCQCANSSEWTGSDCSTPVCQQVCEHGGQCTFPNTCTCAAGWSGVNCTVPLCAQDCNNGGVCIAPDVCKVSTNTSTSTHLAHA